MQDYEYPNCDYTYKDSFWADIADQSAKQSSRIPDYWATQRFEIPSEELYSFFAPDGSYSCPRCTYASYEPWQGERSRGPNTAEQMAMGSLINYLSSSDEYDSNEEEDDIDAALNSYYAKGEPDGDELMRYSMSKFKPNLESTNRTELSAAEALLARMEKEMERLDEDEAVDTFERAANYSLHDHSNKAQYLNDGQNMVKLRSKKYSQIIKKKGKSVINTLTKTFKTKPTPCQATAREWYDYSEESNLSEKFGDIECNI